MRKFLLASATILVLAIPAQAQHHHGHHGRHGGGGGNWAAPLIGGLILGGIVGGALSQPRYAQPPTIYAEPYPYQYQQVCRRQFVGYDYYGNPMFRTVCE
jgi:hypothetical protein